ncbi:unnamed protein product [Cylindrotheca closterium]|uniref:Uncharacterized protein n=1 Tax=Cylindrotheca closterium TaxID=2856 RepID=A0AAD2CX01_9STRA|nr:unnamed protein product [Cylindrotheca closterium]
MPKIRLRIIWIALSATVLASSGRHAAIVHAVAVPSGIIPFTSYRDDYDNPSLQPALSDDDDTIEGFFFHRFQSPSSIQAALKKNLKRKRNPLKDFRGKDGRAGKVSSTKLNGDWVLAESSQVAVNCTVDEVLAAYLTPSLQEKWNEKDVIQCTFHEIQCDDDEIDDDYNPNAKGEDAQPKKGISSRRIPGGFGGAMLQSLHHDKDEKSGGGIRYRQDLVLKSQRVIRSHTGIMRYCQSVTIDKIGKDNYSVLVHLDPEAGEGTTKRPFDSLSVYVGLQQAGQNVDIYAAGVMKVNRKVVPNLVIFDASGIAGSMAGKGTLWLAGHFEQRRQRKLAGSSSRISTSDNKQ